MKVEPPGTGATGGGGPGAGVKSEWSNYGGSTPSREGEEGGGGGLPPPPWPGSKVSSGPQQQTPSQPHKLTATTTPDGNQTLLMFQS